MMPIREMTPKELKRRLQNGERPMIVDVREHEEVAEGMIPGAVHIPLGELPERYEELAACDEVVIVCRSGARSGRACEYLQMLGYSGAVNLAGGMLAWNQADD